MTTGSFIKDQTRVETYYLNGVANGTVRVGQYESKSWSGDDTPTRVLRQPAIRRTYTTLHRRTGHVIKRSFWLRQPKRSSNLPPHPYSMNSFRYHSVPGNMTNNLFYGGAPNGVQVLTNYTIPLSGVSLPPSPVWTSNDDIQLVNALREKVRGSDFNMAVFLGEGHEALRMIGDSAMRLARSYRLARKGDFVGAVTYLGKSARQIVDLRRTARKLPRLHNIRRSATDQLSSNWLELQYGWLPLLSDMKNGAEFLAHQLNVPFRKRYVVRRVLRNSPPQVSFSFKHADYTASVGKQIVAYVSERESIPKLSGLLDPEVVAWELTPFSFVADWFLPVGDWLEARAFASSLTGTFVSTSWQSQKALGAAGGPWTGIVPSSGVSEMSGVEFRTSLFSMNRTISTSLSVPMPVVKPLSKALSYGHCVNAIALLAQVVKAPLNFAR